MQIFRVTKRLRSEELDKREEIIKRFQDSILRLFIDKFKYQKIIFEAGLSRFNFILSHHLFFPDVIKCNYKIYNPAKW